MSLARVQTSHFAARKGAVLRCQKCGREIAKGEVYRWWFKGFRSHHKNVRCTTCPAPRQSELESSNKADAFAAIEAAEDDLAALAAGEDASEVESIVNQAGDSIQEVADAYREVDESFGGGGATVSGEIADELESAAQDLSNWSAQESEPPDPEWCELHDDDDAPDKDGATIEQVRETCDDCISAKEDAVQSWWDNLIDEANSALGDASF